MSLADPKRNRAYHDDHAWLTEEFVFGAQSSFREKTQALLYFFLGLVVVLSSLITFSSAGLLGFLMGQSKAAQTMGFGLLLSVICLIILICLIIYDLFTLPEQVRRFNDDLEEEIVQALLSTKPDQDTPATPAADDDNDDLSMGGNKRSK